jgi:hypothetical protein
MMVSAVARAEDNVVAATAEPNGSEAVATTAGGHHCWHSNGKATTAFCRRELRRRLPP